MLWHRWRAFSRRETGIRDRMGTICWILSTRCRRRSTPTLPPPPLVLSHLRALRARRPAMSSRACPSPASRAARCRAGPGWSRECRIIRCGIGCSGWRPPGSGNGRGLAALRRRVAGRQSRFGRCFRPLSLWTARPNPAHFRENRHSRPRGTAPAATPARRALDSSTAAAALNRN